ncbi:translesion error-prone DNA polymerase V autoproteolytic subunit [Candidatus Peregrinibacteria bacterium]|nr:translesion error-prone DNA polymerase V autoproteolytic subunit [Candidatus Peregrinibacteria bacterium]
MHEIARTKMCLPGEEVRQTYQKDKLDEIKTKNVRLPWEQVRIATFREKIHKIVRKIPAGQALTYKQVAAFAGKPRAFRAVGNILNQNYDPDIPCHRVVKSDGTLGGYNRGEAQKIKKLRQEAMVLPSQEDGLQNRKKFAKCPVFQSTVSAGFPSPAEDFIEETLDLNEKCIKHPAATFFVRVSGSSMINAGIKNNDLLIVDRSIEPSNNKVVIAVINGDFTVKRVEKINEKVFLMPENKNFKPIEITEDMDCKIWGVVTHVIHSV